MYKRLLQGLLVGLCLAVGNFVWVLWRVWSLGPDAGQWGLHNSLFFGVAVIALSVIIGFGYWRSELQTAYMKKTGKYWGRKMGSQEKFGLAILGILIITMGVVMVWIS